MATAPGTPKPPRPQRPKCACGYFFSDGGEMTKLAKVGLVFHSATKCNPRLLPELARQPPQAAPR